MIWAFLQTYVFLIACAYGVVFSVIFGRHGENIRSGWVYYGYVTGFVILLWAVGMNMGAAVASPVGPILALAEGGVILVCNAVALKCTGEYALTRLGRGALGLNHIVYRKTYDKAEAAEARGELALAVEIYRQEIAADPQDIEAQRRLAEVLLKAGRPDEAAAELRHIVDQARQQELRHIAAFRLAEVYADQLGRPADAEALYRRIVEEAPHSRLARYARVRLGRSGPNGTPTDQ
jgi:hypothetical protein